MNHAQHTRFNGILAGLIWVALNLLYSPIAQAEGIRVVVNKDTSVQTLSRNALRAIFGMRLRSWENGSRIDTFVLPDRHPIHRAFAKEVLGLFPHQLRWSWDRLVFSGTGEAPIVVETEDELRMELSNNPGAIGYLSNPKLINSDNDLQIIEIK